ncbi:MAG: DNA repair protein RadC [Clostridia bacterium]|nr:DNA repair protein RadC [Clostridia bacterium]
MIKALAPQERPREKLLAHGVASLSHAELLAIILRSGSHDESAIGLGQKVIQQLDHGLNSLSSVTVEELISLKGIGAAKACQILAAIELGKRVSQSEKPILGRIHSPSSVVSFFQKKLKHENKEMFIVVYLNTKHVITSYDVISIGSLNASIVHPREVFNKAIKKSAAGILLIHNHPSGYPDPSLEDKKITQRLKEAGELIGIQVVDHLIVCDQEYYSFKEMDQL